MMAAFEVFDIAGLVVRFDDVHVRMVGRRRPLRAASKQRTTIQSAARPLTPNGTAGLTTIPTTVRPTTMRAGPTPTKSPTANRPSPRLQRERQT
jgi:hypothetical protein